MPAAIFDLTDERIVEQGSYWALTIHYPGNVATASIRGQIKTTYGGSTLASFSLETPKFEEETNRTKFVIYLSAAQTTKLTPPVDHYVYDLRMLIPSKDPIRLMQGKVKVSPGVTDVQ
ncbi:hypothetical protein IQ268_30525 [Oculatella sp. LEGE 06141]|uniref:hypothetical protein n=1 Tax=Oculatella sp. LEGE 06141 TaxID=1828648 RepID=UPI001881635D|nr:hypothetical protein [Oculatella sp. LEGE 06141]MBE9182874.1 hypothetical protein [Oculatella sp. LEGE 06141]